MSKIPFNKIEKIVSDIFLAEDLSGNLYASNRVPALAILRLSAQFPSLNLAGEDIVLLYDKNTGSANHGFLVTTSNVHFGKGFLPFADLDKLFDEQGNLKLPLPDMPDALRHKVAQLFLALLDYDHKQDMNITKYGNPNRQNNGNNNAGIEIEVTSSNAMEQDLIDDDFLNLLKHEADIYFDTCQQLDADKVFKQTVQKMTNTTDIVVNDPSARELFALDAIKVFKMCSSIDRVVTRREQFALAYLFDRLVNNSDMAESIKLGRINEMIQNPKFQQNIERLQTFKIYEVKSEFPDELVLPVILSKLDHELLSAVSSQLHRFASLILKADGKVTPEEEDMLKKVWELTHKPKKAVPNVKQTEVNNNESFDDVIKELNELIGLKNIKEEIKTLINFLKVQKVREEKGLATQDRALHSVFMGPPGTGKTTIARLVGRIYKHLGILKRGHLVETDRAGLVAGYIGQTALKVDEVVKAALDGVLFIDEAYALSRDGEDKRDFGAEAIETLLKRMEDYRKQLVVIVAGYPDEMETFIKSNPGLQSRFNRYFFFNHYSPEELVAIFKQFAAKADFKLTEEAEEKLLFIFEKVCENRPKNFGNARAARNLFEQCIERQANRIVSIAPLTEEILINLTEEDIPPVNETVKSILVFDPKKDAAQQQQQPDLTQIAKVLNTIVPQQQEEEEQEEPTPEEPAKQPENNNTQQQQDDNDTGNHNTNR